MSKTPASEISSDVIAAALGRVRDETTFIHELLAVTLNWPIPESGVTEIGDITYDWPKDQRRAPNVEKKLAGGRVLEMNLAGPGQHWGIFILEFNSPHVFDSDRGMTGVLREVLRWMVPSRVKAANQPSWARDHLLFICTHDYTQFRFAYFKDPKSEGSLPRLAAFGWHAGSTAVRTVCEFNLKYLGWPADPSDTAAWVARWAKAFDVEQVTKQFYKDYKIEFDALRERINGLGMDTEAQKMFTQTLMNRLMFLRFVERKQWLTPPGGTAPSRDYLHLLFRVRRYRGKSFYAGRIARLFFDGLAVEGKQECEAIGKVPFLNGGLFEKTKLDDAVADIADEAFEPLLGPKGLFYRYNFTVQESTPLDIEVAVDPEMLGKVFEELVTGRHESGSYYTPRPVVSYMCREAIKGFLSAHAGAAPVSIEALVDRHEIQDLTESHARQIIDALDSLKAVDPACGSGAYLLGLLQELVALYRLLYSDKLVRDTRTLYDLKLRIISHNLYGVDIDPFATNIAMLRLWLSLTVEGSEPLPLPNLEFKIETGDSIIGPDPSAMPDLFRLKLQSEADELVQKKDEYLKCHDRTKQIKWGEIQLKQELFAQTLQSAIGKGVIDWRIHFAEVFAGKAARSTVDGRFSLVNMVRGAQQMLVEGEERGGFDIVLANPPYVRQELIKELKPTLKRVYAENYSGTADFYVFFYLRALQLLAKGGMLVFISSNRWFRAGYGEKLRAHIAKTTTVQTILDFHDLPVFEAIAYPMIFVAKKQPPSDAHTATLAEPPNLESPYPDVKEVAAKFGHQMPKTALGRDGTWHLGTSSVADRLAKMRSAGDVLAKLVRNRIYRGVMTGLNEAFIVDDETRNALINDEPTCKSIFRPIAAGKDVAKWHVRDSGRWLLFVPWDFELKRYSSIRRHLSGFREQLEGRPDVREGRHVWWALSRYGAEHVNDWDHANIAYQEIATHQGFALGHRGQFYNNKAFFIVSDDRYLLSVLNSKACWWFLGQVTAKLVADAYALQRPYMEQIPVPAATTADRVAIGALAQKCLDAKGIGCEGWEKEIDERVSALYGL